MAKALMLVSVFCFLAFATYSHAQEKKNKVYTAYGGVYCDPCNFEFYTRLSYPIPGAKVQVQCRARDNNTVTVKVKGVTNEDGGYSIDVAGDHADEICEVSALSSPDTKCNKPFTNGDKAAVSLTDIGVQGTCRYANPIGFKNSTALDPACEDVLIELNCVAAPCLPNGE